MAFSNLNIIGFKFKDAVFGNKECTDLSKPTFNNCNFEGAVLKGKEINLAGSKLDYKNI